MSLDNSKAVLALLGSFWNQYYKDVASAQKLVSGEFNLCSTEYDRVLQTVLMSNIFDIPEYQTLAYSIKIFDLQKLRTITDAEGTVLYWEYVCTEDIPYLTSALLEPTVVLQKGVQYDIVGNVIKFYVDLFNDPYLVQNIYSTGNQFILLWAVNTVLHETYIYDRYGVYLYDRLTDSAVSKAIYTALQYFYTNQKTIKNIEVAFNILLGMSYTKYDNETVTAITADKFITDKAEYTYNTKSNIIVQVGDVLSKFTLLNRVIKVDDYQTDSDWYLNGPFPLKTIESINVCLDSVVQPKVYLNGAYALSGNHFLTENEPYFLPNPEVLYSPIKLDGSLQLKGAYPVSEVPLKSNVMRQDSILYNIMHNMLKYNMFQVFYDVYDGSTSVTTALDKGIPAYVDYALNIVMHIDPLTDSVPPIYDGAVTCVGKANMSDGIFEITPVFLDGSILCDGQYKLNGAYKDDMPTYLTDSIAPEIFKTRTLENLTDQIGGITDTYSEVISLLNGAQVVYNGTDIVYHNGVMVYYQPNNYIFFNLT